MTAAVFPCIPEMLKSDKLTLDKTLKSQIEMVDSTNINVEIICILLLTLDRICDASNIRKNCSLYSLNFVYQVLTKYI